MAQTDNSQKKKKANCLEMYIKYSSPLVTKKCNFKIATR